MDTFGVNALVEANHRATQAGATLALLELPARVRDVLEMARCGCSRSIAKVA